MIKTPEFEESIPKISKLFAPIFDEQDGTKNL